MDKLTNLTAALWGLVQGLAGLLPVSASGHMLLFGRIFGFSSDTGAAAALRAAAYIGMLLAICLIYSRRILSSLRHPVKGELKYLALSALPAAAQAFTLNKTGFIKVIDDCRETLLPYAFLFTALILLLADGIAKNRRIAKATHKHIDFKDALWMGLMQCLGVFAGVSREASAVTGGIAGGLDRNNAADFSYIMAVPLLAGAAVMEGRNAAQAGFILSENTVPLLIGMLMATIGGAAAVWLMRRCARKIRLKWFSLYLGLLALITFADGVWNIF